jgi:D-cysteine desulfhydrase family pyridoxal phosphate-dependent enzyme
MKTLPRIKFAHLPTALEPLSQLSRALGGPRIWVKRDDQTGLAFGGNKTRKLEFLLAEAAANGARTLITAGADQSNHCRQTAAAAARNGFECILVLTLPQGSDQPPSPDVAATGNLLLDRLLGAEIVWASRPERDQVLQRTFEDAWETGRRPYMIPYGGSNPTGAAAYVFAMQELMGQDPSLDWIVFPSSSGGTQAGLVLGAKHFDYKGHVLGISVDERADVLQARVAGLANQTAELLDVEESIQLEDVLVDDRYLGGGYGVLGEPEREAVRLFAHHEGLFLDPVYTGRAGAGLIDLIRQGFFSTDDAVLFWHTGGTPALFAGRYQDLAPLPPKSKPTG